MIEQMSVFAQILSFSRWITRKSASILLIFALIYTSAYAMFSDDEDENSPTSQAASTSSPSSTAEDNTVTPFEWQNKKHFEEQKALFSSLTQLELNHIIDRAITKINESGVFLRIAIR